MRRVYKIALATAALGLGTISAPAAAVVVPTSDGTCTSPSADTVPNATLCTGYYTGNIFDNNAGDQAAITAALAGFGITYSGDISNYPGATGLGGATDLSSIFGTLTGVQVLGIHYGGGAGGGESAFYQIDFGAGATLMLNLPASSNAYLFSSNPAVPEPATWAMMLLGFGGIGMAMRRSRRRNSALMQVA